MALNSRFTMDQVDGARWHVFHDSDDPSRYATFTASGVEVMQHDPTFKPLLKEYKNAALAGVVGQEEPDIRRPLGSGQQAQVYTMGKRFAVRETPGNDNFYAGVSELEQMNRLADIIDTGTPRWLRTPEHFLRMSDPDTGQVYTVMRRVNDGITVEDLAQYPNTDHASRVERHFGGAIPESAERAILLFDRARVILDRLIEKAGMEPGTVLTDWKHRNALIQKLRTPVAGERHTLNVIDQY